MIDILDSRAVNSVVDFKSRALPILEGLLREGKIPLICGGTNYYIESLLWKVLIDEETPYLIGGKRKDEAKADGEPRKRPRPAETERVETQDSDLARLDFDQDDETIPTERLYKYLSEVG